ncbi:hypothetical protein JZ751_010735 [Albula glossodonta]|uniref:Uncharacterized protein n=1 Tax=Albula glossodonta TaxID=121402 RepID=A0A8T2N1B1_9TELE|nr:hypothetical protein JZ751_010735 [Albula glossodonta]
MVIFCQDCQRKSAIGMQQTLRGLEILQCVSSCPPAADTERVGDSAVCFVLPPCSRH